MTDLGRAISTDSIAIIGLGCRLPGAESIPDYWALLSAGKQVTRKAPMDRLALHDKVFGCDPDLTDSWVGGFLDDVFSFDCDYFSITPREARAMDPQQRLVLQTSAMAIADAGISIQTLAEATTGVFTGVSTHDYSILSWAAKPGIYTAMGTANGLTANRISHWLNATGPSVAFDTACSSALVALHYARQGLLLQECNFALCASASVMLLPEVSQALQAAGMVSKEGCCKPFDANASGYVRGEGAGTVLMCRLDDAIEKGYPVYATIRGSAVNHNGLSNGLTAPNPKQQVKLIQRAYATAGLGLDDCDYIETMAAAQVMADALELKALQESVGDGRSRGDACLLGSVKGNLGHLEAASGMAGLIKLILSIQHAQLPPSIGVDRLHPFLERDTTRLKLVQQLLPWPERPSGKATRIGGISAFGFGGANAHVIVEQTLNAPVRETICKVPSDALSVDFKAGVTVADSLFDQDESEAEGTTTQALAKQLEHRLKQSGF